MECVHAVSAVRRMRGRTQSWLVSADDGHDYVVKFRDNPEGRRTLINEWVGTRLLQYLHIPCAPPAVVHFTSEFFLQFPDVVLLTADGPVRPATGVHFGSRYAGAADTAVFYFIPDKLLPNVLNIQDFVRVLAFDAWAGNADARQCVFVRNRTHDPAISSEQCRRHFVAIMIDHGCICDGASWTFVGRPGGGLYFRPAIYDSLNSDVFDRTIEHVAGIRRSVIDTAVAEMPCAWIEPDHDALDTLIETLMRRQQCARRLAYDSRALASLS